MNQCKVIAITNQKGGVGKTVTSLCLATCLSKNDKQVLIVDLDPQGNLTKGMGYRDQGLYQFSIKEAILNEIDEIESNKDDFIINTNEGFDLIPANISLSGMDIQLSNVMSRETILKRIISRYREDYDYILIDCNPALNLLTINALVAADSVIIPVQAEPYATDGLYDLIKTISKAQKHLNRNLEIGGILLTMTDCRTNLSKYIGKEVRNKYGLKINVFNTEIPRTVRMSEAALFGITPINHAPKSEASIAYNKLVKEIEHLYEKTVQPNSRSL